MAGNISFDSAESDLLCDEETKGLCFDNGETYNHPTCGENGYGRSDLDPFILLPCLSEDCIGWMIQREREHLPRDDYLSRLRNGELDLSLRREALDWMIKACAHHNFGELSLCLAMNYLDRFLSVYNLPRSKNWAIQLVAVSCLSLAAKIEEVDVPSTIDLQAGDPKFLFEGKTIQRMEILVMNYLKWNMRSYTPFNFIEYYLRKMNNDSRFDQGRLITRSIQVILSTIKGIDFLEFKPSEAAAAVAVFVSGETRALDIDKALSRFNVEKDRVVKCLELIQDLISTGGTTPVSTTTTTSSGNVVLSSSVPSSPNGVLDAACMSYKSDERTSSHTKRRKIDHETAVDGGS